MRMAQAPRPPSRQRHEDFITSQNDVYSTMSEPEALWGTSAHANQHDAHASQYTAHPAASDEPGWHSQHSVHQASSEGQAYSRDAPAQRQLNSQQQREAAGTGLRAFRSAPQHRQQYQEQQQQPARSFGRAGAYGAERGYTVAHSRAAPAQRTHPGLHSTNVFGKLLGKKVAVPRRMRSANPGQSVAAPAAGPSLDAQEADAAAVILSLKCSH